MVTNLFFFRSSRVGFDLFRFEGNRWFSQGHKVIWQRPLGIWPVFHRISRWVGTDGKNLKQ